MASGMRGHSPGRPVCTVATQGWGCVQGLGPAKGTPRPTRGEWEASTLTETPSLIPAAWTALKF